MNRTNIVVLILLSILVFAGCDPADNKLCFKNNSNIDVVLFYSCDTTFDNFYVFKSGYYRDMISGDSIYVEHALLVKRSTSKKIVERGFNAWNRYLKDCNGKIYLYIFPDTVLDKFPKEEIIRRRMYVRVLELTLQELKDNNWTITYP